MYNNHRGNTSMNISVYKKLKDELKSLIEARKMLPGEPLPSENQLARKYKISRSSVRLALHELEDEGLIIKKQGKGSKKHGRNKRPVNQATSAYVRGKISFETYQKQTKKA